MNIEDYVEKWKRDYHERKDVGESLTDARERKLLLYKNICSTHGEMLFYTNDQFCPCCAKVARDRRAKENRNFERGRGLFHEIKRRAKKKNIKYEITKEDIREIYGTVKQCPILKIDIDYSGGHGSGPRENSPSIDRLIPKYGYVPDNINVLSHRANRIKSDGTAEEHILIAMRILKQQNFDNKYVLNFINNLLDKEGKR